MTTLYIEIEKRLVKTSKPIIKEMLWYDVHTKTMHKYTGSELKFRYDIDAGRMIPYVEKEKTETKEAKVLRYDFEKKKLQTIEAEAKPSLKYMAAYEMVSNEKEILNWIHVNKAPFGISVNLEDSRPEVLCIEIEEENEDLAKASLDRYGFRYY